MIKVVETCLSLTTNNCEWVTATSLQWLQDFRKFWLLHCGNRQASEHHILYRLSLREYSVFGLFCASKQQFCRWFALCYPLSSCSPFPFAQLYKWNWEFILLAFPQCSGPSSSETLTWGTQIDISDPLERIPHWCPPFSVSDMSKMSISAVPLHFMYPSCCYWKTFSSPYTMGSTILICTFHSFHSFISSIILG